MAHHLARLQLQLVSAWLIIFHLGVPIFSLETSNITTSNPLIAELKDSNDSITFRSCCSKDPANSSGNEFCNNESFVLSWDVLKSYRVQAHVSKEIQVSDGEILNSDEIPLNCANLISLTIPIWKPSQGSYNPRFFASFHPDGLLQYGKYIYSPDDFCVQRFTPKAITVAACNYSFQCMRKSRPCITRCCDYGEVWDVSGTPFRCKGSGDLKWEPEINSGPSRNMNEKSLVIVSHPRDLVKTSCKNVSYSFQSPHPLIQEDDKLEKIVGSRPFKVLEDGTVWLKLRKLEWAQLNPGEYCIDGFQFGEGNFSGVNMEALLFECKEFETSDKLMGQERQRKYSLGFGIILVFCLIFLLMTVIVYVLLWSKHNIHGWTVFCYIIALLVTYLLLGTSHFASISLEREEEQHGSLRIPTFCGIIAILCHFAFLSTFSWSTVLNFDLWCTFRNLRPVSGKSSGRKKFLLYCLFALAVPTLIVGVGLFLDIKYNDDVHSDIITPDYGKVVCYVNPRHARFFYVIIPIAALLWINLLLFCNTAYALYKVKKSTAFASSSSTKNETGNQTFRLILKLLLINGTIWAAEIISWYLQTDHEAVGTASFILDIVIVSQAVAIFFLFVFKNDILQSLRNTYPCLQGTVKAAFKLKSLVSSSHSKERRVTTTSSLSNRTAENNMPVTKL